jgi:hypothetical protein
MKSLGVFIVIVVLLFSVSLKGVASSNQECIKRGPVKLNDEKTEIHKVRSDEKGTSIQIYVGQIRFFSTSILCSTVVLYATDPFDESTITWNNRPPKKDSLTAYKCISLGWYTFPSTSRLENYVTNKLNAGDTVAFVMEILDRNSGVCDLVWYFSTKESENIPRLIHNSETYLAIGDSWVTDGPPGSPYENYGSDPEMLVCSCTLTARSGTQLAYVQFYRPPSSIEEESKKVGFIFESQPNPFSSVTYLRYAVFHKKERVSLRIYDIMGNLVKILKNEVQPVGEYRVAWDGKDFQGREVPSGYYFSKLTIGDNVSTIKILLLRGRKKL